MATQLRRGNPFKQRHRPKQQRGDGSSSGGGGGGASHLIPGQLQLQTVGEWDDGLSVSSVASSHQSDALLGGDMQSNNYGDFAADFVSGNPFKTTPGGGGSGPGSSRETGGMNLPAL